MKLKNSFFYTLRESPKDEESVSGILLNRAGYIKKSSAGVYMYLPLGYKVIKNIEKIINEDKTIQVFSTDKGLLKQDSQSHIVTYEVTIEKNGVKQTITLATAIESYYCFDGTRDGLSLQNSKYDIK